MSIIFDGYDDEMSIKLSEHVRRSALKSSTPNIKISEHSQSFYSKERFLSNPNNKKELISLLPTSFMADSQDLCVCKGDADSKIASTALELTKENQVLIVADDTDVAVLLLHRWNEDLKDIFFMNGNKCWSIKDTQYRFGEKVLKKLLKKSWKPQNVSDIMNYYWATENDVCEAAVAAFIEIYCGSVESNLTKLRYTF